MSEESCECVCGTACHSCGCTKQLSISNMTFWDLWLMKIFRNFASMKFQWLLFLYVPTVWGMFNIRPGTNMPWISAALGLGLLGGGFVTLATSRLIARTKLTESKHDDFDTEVPNDNFDTEVPNNDFDTEAPTNNFGIRVPNNNFDTDK